MPEITTPEIHDVIIIGAGPAGLSAAIYTTREDIDTVLYEKGVIGGLAAITDWVDNYPGFKEGVAGLALAEELQAQAERFGADIRLGEVSKITDDGEYKVLETTDGPIKAKAVLIATGSEYKMLDIPGEKEFYARGVHYCATCDGAFYRDKKLVVVGGGNSAIQESLFLTKFASHIDILVRSTLKASEVLLAELEKHKDKITVHLGVTPVEVASNDRPEDGGKVIGVKGRPTAGGDEKLYEADGVFVFIGLKPQSEFVANSAIELDAIGLIKTDENLQTSIHGVFCAGDVRSHATMQIASAVGEGATAALKIREFLEPQSSPAAVTQVD